MVISTVEQLSGWELVQWGANPLEMYWRLKLGGGRELIKHLQESDISTETQRMRWLQEWWQGIFQAEELAYGEHRKGWGWERVWSI